MIVAAHRGDLEGARSCSLRTAFLYRPHEFGPGRAANKANPGDFDIICSDAADLAALRTTTAAIGPMERESSVSTRFI